MASKKTLPRNVHSPPLFSRMPVLFFCCQFFLEAQFFIGCFFSNLAVFTFKSVIFFFKKVFSFDAPFFIGYVYGLKKKNDGCFCSPLYPYSYRAYPLIIENHRLLKILKHWAIQWMKDRPMRKMGTKKKLKKMGGCPFLFFSI